MRCRKCGGFVYHDSMYKSESYVDLSCLMCGKRWFIKKNNPLVRYLAHGHTSA